MQRLFLLISGIFGVIAVSFGALGAHFLKEKISTEQIEIFNKGVLYHFFHCIALLVVISLMNKIKSRALILSGFCFIAGIIFFSGSLYLLATKEFFQLENWNFLGPITPVGGIFFILGWIMIGVSAFRT